MTSTLLWMTLIFTVTTSASSVIDPFPLSLSSSPVANCDGCWCIAYNSSTGKCPTWTPATYTNDTINALALQTPLNPFELFCNPYANASCTTVPPQPPLPANATHPVCGLKYMHTNNNNENNNSCTTGYRMITYGSWDEATADSTTQDLAAYMRHPDLTSIGKMCAALGLLNVTWGTECYMKYGFTR
eukprot:PhF_6_TR4388/c0_g1_i2/m.5925